MSVFLRNNPFLPAVLCLIAGIAIAEGPGVTTVLVAVLAVLSGAAIFYRPVLVFLIFIPIGMILYHPVTTGEGSVSAYSGKKVDIEGVLFRPLESRETGSRLYLDLSAAIDSGRPVDVTGKVYVSTAERISGIARGDHVRVMGVRLFPFQSYRNEGGFDLQRYYRRQGIVLKGHVKGAESIVNFGRPSGVHALTGSIEALRSGFIGFVRGRVESPESEIILALTAGEKRAIPTPVRDAFANLGLAHLLTISGLHVAAIALISFFFAKALLKTSERVMLRFDINAVAALISLPPLVFYVLFSGFALPVQRAFIAALIVIGALVLGKRTTKLNLISLCAFVIVVLEPSSVFSLSFQLSFLSVLGIVAMHHLSPFRFDTPLDLLWAATKTTLGAVMATLPIVADKFGQVPVLAVPANLLFVPVVELLLVPAGMLAVALYMIGPALAGPPVDFLELAAHFMTVIVDDLSSLKLANVSVSPMGWLAWGLYAVAVASVLGSKGLRWMRVPAIVCGTAFFAVLFLGSPLGPRPGGLKVIFPHAPGRSMVLARFPGGSVLVIDSGWGRGRSDYPERSVLLPLLRAEGIRGIDYFFLEQHSRGPREGFKTVASKMPVGWLVTPTNRLDGEIWDMVYNGGLGWIGTDELGLPMRLDGAEIDVLGGEAGGPVLFRLGYGSFQVLVSTVSLGDGDLDGLLMAHGEGLRADVLFVPYLPGGLTALGPGCDFLRAVGPGFIVAGRVGEGAAGGGGCELPPVFAVGEEGQVTVSSDGRGAVVRAFSGRELVLQAE